MTDTLEGAESEKTLRISASDKHFVKYWGDTVFTRLSVSALFKYLAFLMRPLFEGGKFLFLYNRPAHSQSSGDRVINRRASKYYALSIVIREKKFPRLI